MNLLICVIAFFQFFFANSIGNVPTEVFDIFLTKMEFRSLPSRKIRVSNGKMQQNQTVQILAFIISLNGWDVTN